ncbi:MAG: hypothetical protein RI900_1234 [Actinomycetota bacterium]
MVVAATPEAPLTRGHKKKSRTRQQLLDAAFTVLAERGEGFSIADVAARAGVSNGTFYNYFDDREQLLSALVAHTVQAFAAGAARVVDESDPARRFALISARALSSAVRSPDTVRFALRLEAAQRALVVDGPLAYLRDDLDEGHRTGRFPEAPDAATIDVILGSLLLAARRLLDDTAPDDYGARVIRRLLMSLGVDGDEAQHIAHDAVRRA